MRKFSILLTLLLALLLGSCSNEIIEPTLQPNNDGGRSTRVDMNTALERAEEMLAKIEGGKTRSLTVAEIRFLNVDSKTRSDRGLDSLYYLINYSDNGGFAVAGADTRLDKIYAISEEGHLDESDLTNNPGLQYFIDMLPDEQTLAIIGNPDLNPDTTILVGPPSSFNEDIDLSVKMGPYIHKNVSKWDQRHPYNYLCPTKDNQKCLAGCGPVATAIIMSFYEWPTQYSNTHFDWQYMKSATVSNGAIVPSLVAEFIRILGAGNNYDTNYNTDGSSSRTSHYKRTFKNLGF